MPIFCARHWVQQPSVGASLLAMKPESTAGHQSPMNRRRSPARNRLTPTNTRAEGLDVIQRYQLPKGIPNFSM